MATVGLIGTGLAYLNLKKAQKEYDALKEQQDGLEAAVRMYNYSKLDAYAETIDTKDNDLPDGLLMTTILRVGNLVGKLMRVKASIVLTNTSSSPIYVSGISAECYVFDIPVNMYRFEMDPTPLSQVATFNQNIQPGQTVEIRLQSGISSLGDMMGELRNMICEACGKKLITSCPKIDINGGQKANISISWGDQKNGVSLNRPGVLRYCGEAFYPN